MALFVRMHATDKFDNRARAAREGPFDRNVERPLALEGLVMCARAEHVDAPDEKVMFFFS